MNNISIKQQENTLYTYLFFLIADVHYAIPVYNVIEILPFCSLQAPQKLQKNTIGLLDYNGLLLNVIDLRTLLGLEKQEYSINQKFIIIKTDEAIFALVADGIFNIYDVDTTLLQSAPNATKNLIQSIYNTSEYTVSVLNIPAIETAIKQHDLEEIEDFKLPVLSKEDTQIAIERAGKIKTKNSNYYVSKYFEYVKYLTFAVGNAKFCIDISYIEKVLDTNSLTITPIPNNKNYLEGIINFRGSFLTIINFAKYTGIETNNNSLNENKKIIVISNSNIKIGILVDKMFEISDITNEELTETNEFSSVYSFIHHQIVKNNDIYFIIDVINLLNDSKIYIND